MEKKVESIKILICSKMKEEKVLFDKKDEERKMENNSGIRTVHIDIYVKHFHNEMKAITFYAT